MINSSGECGVDEAGRGSFFGRLYVGAVIFPENIELDPEIVKDSKKFHSRTRRMEARDYILKHCLYSNVAWAEPEEIDRDGIIVALMQTMHSAIRGLPVKPSHLLIDGDRFEPYEDVSHETVIGGDSKHFSIAAASILAKVAHDEHILSMLERYPELEKYGLKKNMGYGTQQHREAIKNEGLSSYHRKVFCEKTLGLRKMIKPDTNGCFI